MTPVRSNPPSAKSCRNLASVRSRPPGVKAIISMSTSLPMSGSFAGGISASAIVAGAPLTTFGVSNKTPRRWNEAARTFWRNMASAYSFLKPALTFLLPKPSITIKK